MVAAALQIVEREGADAVTMRRVAQELDTGAASLYRHIASREELLGLLGVAILDNLDPLENRSDLPWPDEARRWALATRHGLRRHLGWVSLLLGPDTPSIETHPHFQRGVRVFTDAGISLPVAYGAAQSIAFVVLSFVGLEAQWPDSLAVEPGALVPNMTPTNVFPDGRTNDETFTFLVDSVIAGIQQRLAAGA